MLDNMEHKNYHYGADAGKYMMNSNDLLTRKAALR